VQVDLNRSSGIAYFSRKCCGSAIKGSVVLYWRHIVVVEVLELYWRHIVVVEVLEAMVLFCYIFDYDVFVNNVFFFV